MKLKEWQKNILSAAIVIVVGFALFLMAFLLLALITRVALVLFTGEGESKARPIESSAARPDGAASSLRISFQTA